MQYIPRNSISCPHNTYMDPTHIPHSAHLGSPHETHMNPVAKFIWAPCGQPTWGPQSSPQKTHVGPIILCWLGSELFLKQRKKGNALPLGESVADQTSTDLIGTTLICEIVWWFFDTNIKINVRRKKYIMDIHKVYPVI